MLGIKLKKFKFCMVNNNIGISSIFRLELIPFFYVSFNDVCFWSTFEILTSSLLDHNFQNKQNLIKLFIIFRGIIKRNRSNSTTLRSASEI